MRGLLRYMVGKKRVRNDIQETIQAVSHSIQLKTEGERKKLDYFKIRDNVEGATVVSRILVTLNNKQDVLRLNKATQ